MMGSKQMSTVWLVALALGSASAFQPLVFPTQRRHQGLQQPVHPGSLSRTTRAVWSRQPSLFQASPVQDDEDDRAAAFSETKEKTRLSRFRQRVSKFLKKKLVVAVFVGSSIAGIWTPRPAEASAPVMAVPKAEQRDPATDALLNHDRKMVVKQQQELQEMNKRAREIEASEGTAARSKFEKEYKAQKEKEAQDRIDAVTQLKRDLLDQGMDPFTTIEGQRQVILAEKGVDLGKVPGTMMYLQKQLEGGKKIEKSLLYKQAPNRRVVKAMVEDMKNKGRDPLAYFDDHQEQTQTIMAMTPVAAAQLAQKYQANLEQYGQINVPKEGEMSVKEKMEKAGANKSKDKEQQKKEKEEQKRAKAEAKAKAAAEKKAAKEEAKAAREAQKKEKEAAKVAKKAAVAAAAVAVSGVETTAQSVVGSAVEAATPSSDGGGAGIAGDADTATAAESTTEEETTSVAPPAAKKSKKANTVKIGGAEIPVLPLAGVGVVAVGGGGYAFKIMQDRAALAEEEREKQFRLLMGMDEDEDTQNSPGSAPALEVVDDGLGGLDSMDKTEAPPEPTPMPAPKKKRRGFFGKKNKNSRETDLAVLVSEGATAPQFAGLLAKILTYGAPGRFPSVDRLPGDMPFQEFELEAAKQRLTDSREEAGIALEESAEVFANVVNCMLIDIVDLASSTLKAKDDKVTVDGIGVVIDFMNHASSLYDSVAGGTVIEPVTYGGNLGKGQLEKMYSAYATSGMMNLGDMDTDFEARVSLLQDAFQISEKKAQGLTMKALQKNMMKMMKDGDMEDMMKQFGGEGGLEGLAGMEGMMGEEGEVDPEQLKESLKMLKQMKDSGAFDPSELEAVKAQFRETYGQSLDEVITQGDEEGVDSADKELLDLMKAILDD